METTTTQPGGGTVSMTETPGGGTGTQNQELSKPWLEQVERSLRGHSALSEVNDVNDLSRRYIELGDKLKSMQGESEGLVKLPGENATDDEKAAFYKAMGVPEAADGYQFGKPDNLPESLPYDEGLEKAYKEKVHELGVPESQAKAIFDFYHEIVVNSFNEAQRQHEEQVEADRNALRNEWRDAFDENLGLAMNAAEKFGGEDFAKLLKSAGLDSDPMFVKTFYNIGKAISDDSFMGGSRGKGEVSDDAKALKMFPSMRQNK